MEIENEITVWENENGDMLAKIHDFFAIHCNGNSDRVIDLGLDAIQPDCLRMEWEEADPIFIGEHPIKVWAEAIHKEWETLG